MLRILYLPGSSCGIHFTRANDGAHGQDGGGRARSRCRTGGDNRERGMLYIASRVEAVIAGTITITLEMLAEHHRGTDAVVISTFSDPGLIAARELFEAPITVAESAILTACMLGRRFAILTFPKALVA